MFTRWKFKLTVCLSLLTLGLLANLRADAKELLVNGGFETGDFTGWRVADQPEGNGSWFVRNSGAGPLTGLPTAGPAGGNYYAVTDQPGTGSHSLTQTFTVAPGAKSVIFSFDQFTNNYASAVFDNGTLNLFNGFNQYATVDLLSGSAGAFDVGPNVIHNFYCGADSLQGVPNPYTHYSFDITNYVFSGGTFQIRFAESDNRSYFNQGVDNVSISETSSDPSPTPEPATTTGMGVGALALLGMIFSTRKKARRTASEIDRSSEV